MKIIDFLEIRHIIFSLFPLTCADGRRNSLYSPTFNLSSTQGLSATWRQEKQGTKSPMITLRMMWELRSWRGVSDP